MAWVLCIPPFAGNTVIPDLLQKFMARATFVKSARKDNPEHGIKASDSYYWWAFRTGSSSYKVYSKTKPTRSQLTQSSFLSQIYDLEDREFTGETPEDLQSQRDEMVSDLENLADECESSRDNMPEGLQHGDTGQLLENRAEGCRSTASEFESVDLEYDEESDGNLEEWLETKRQELSDVSFEYE